MKILASHNPDSNIRHCSSAGGVFSILADHVIAEGGAIYGAAFDSQWHIAHYRATNGAELLKLRGSKYAYSLIGTAIADAMADLEAGRRVLFSGTPCQVAAMRKRAGEHPGLLLVEVVCHGAPEQKYWQQYLAEICAARNRKISDIAGINFRDKRTGWKNYSFTISFADGTEFTEPHDRNLYMRAFLSDLTLREACFRCPFKYPDGTCADITLGDLWGISSLAPNIDNDLGTTLVIARTPVGEAAISTISCDANLTLEDVARHNPAIVSAASKMIRYNEFRASKMSLFDRMDLFSYRKPSMLRRICHKLKKTLFNLE
ncbi:MAG: Coenzyme F420 hydrogenase/dehydrogenase, beta subunit C-terminal domain [Muribaculaceae bacterium]|nr:Coenzyme F420 hydrogenase/dehydrogenase, beta subunit C-terminal domain [Muribaculaceae bacterium]